MNVQAFETVRAAPSGGGRMRVEGRAYELIRIGDDLYIDSTSPPLRVVEIASYGAALEELYPVMTGALVLDGPGVERVMDTAALYFGDVAGATGRE